MKISIVKNIIKFYRKYARGFRNFLLNISSFDKILICISTFFITISIFLKIYTPVGNILNELSLWFIFMFIQLMLSIFIVYFSRITYLKIYDNYDCWIICFSQNLKKEYKYNNLNYTSDQIDKIYTFIIEIDRYCKMNNKYKNLKQTELINYIIYDIDKLLYQDVLKRNKYGSYESKLITLDDNTNKMIKNIIFMIDEFVKERKIGYKQNDEIIYYNLSDKWEIYKL